MCFSIKFQLSKYLDKRMMTGYVFRLIDVFREQVQDDGIQKAPDECLTFK